MPLNITKISPKRALCIAYELMGSNWPRYTGTVYNDWIYKKICHGTTFEERMKHQEEFKNLSIDQLEELRKETVELKKNGRELYTMEQEIKNDIIRLLERKFMSKIVPVLHGIEVPKRPLKDPFAYYLKSLGDLPNDHRELRQRFINAKYAFERDIALQEKWKNHAQDIQNEYLIQKKEIFAKRIRIRREFLNQIEEKM